MRLLLATLTLAFLVRVFGDEIEQRIRDFYYPFTNSSYLEVNWTNPTLDDYWQIQRILQERSAKILEAQRTGQAPFPTEPLRNDFAWWASYRMQRFCLINEEKEPQRYVEYFSNSPDQRDQAIICYCSFPRYSGDDRDYERAIKHLIQALEKVQFPGHLIYYLGGWPNVEKGRLKFADVPYGFKPFLFEEARDLGYKKVLWLDACVLPIASLHPLFEHIQKKGCLVFSDGEISSWGTIDDGYVLTMPSYAHLKGKTIQGVVSQVVGFNFDHQAGNFIFDKWLKFAEDRLAYLSGDQVPLRFLINYYHFSDKLGPNDWYCFLENVKDKPKFLRKNPHVLLFHDYSLLDPNSSFPEQFFK